MKRQQDDLNKIRTEFMNLSKKDGGTLMTKDITDDVYKKVRESRKWVSETSEMFTNVLMLVPKVKAAEFRALYLSTLSTITLNKTMMNRKNSLNRHKLSLST